MELVFDDRVVENRKGIFQTQNGRTLEADVAVWCAGILPNPPNMAGFNDDIFTKHKALRVEETLQLKGYPHIFIGGDLTDVKEEKTAQNAERHAKHITKNICRHIKGSPVAPYHPRTGPLIISLGLTHGLMRYKNWTLKGLVPGLLKWSRFFLKFHLTCGKPHLN